MSATLWPPKRRTPFGAYYFEVEIQGTVYPFKSCGGLKRRVKRILTVRTRH